jgi:hypothetical protein
LYLFSSLSAFPCLFIDVFFLLHIWISTIVVRSVSLKRQHETLPYIAAAAARVRSQVKSCGIFGGQGGTGGGGSPNTWVSPANSHSTICSAFINHRIIHATGPYLDTDTGYSLTLITNDENTVQ